jgi:Flp pilus assembly pilin Flp
MGNQRLARDESGQNLAEYGIALALVGAITVGAALGIGVQIGSLWNPVVSTLGRAAHDHGHHHGGGNSGAGGGNGP